MPSDKNIVHLLQYGHPGRRRRFMNPLDPPLLIWPPTPEVVKPASDVIDKFIWPEVRRGHHPIPRWLVEDTIILWHPVDENLTS